MLERAIAARRRCADWFLKTGVQDKRSETGHSHFIEVLQRALDLLGPSPPSEEHTAGQHENRTAGATEKNPHQHAASLENRFAPLEVEDGEDDITVADITSVVPNAPGSKNKAPTTNVYDLALEEHSEATFHVFCYMEDLYGLQHQLLELWKKQKKGQLDLITATVVTTAALDLVAKVEKEIYEKYRSHFHYGRSYDDLTLMIYLAECIRAGEDLEEKLYTPKTPGRY